ncbi:hypothetical protein E2C01_054846 [Portunus trituberculatus]|uniref:Uncharacterized protein n=1 Tax=Portunus trituberculatus TaxID=210409 RepID=A0A5B7GT11_PORTR|nr:hypothetical protein [Portunus trituberculatus]
MPHNSSRDIKTPVFQRSDTRPKEAGSGVEAQVLPRCFRGPEYRCSASTCSASAVHAYQEKRNLLHSQLGTQKRIPRQK